MTKIGAYLYEYFVIRKFNFDIKTRFKQDSVEFHPKKLKKLGCN